MDGRGIRLAADAAKEAAKPIWVQVAKSGTFLGHPDFPAGIVFDKALFDGVVANLHKHPAFEAGEDGIGAAPVVPFDYEHASEMDPTSGSIPSGGAPAPGWILDLQVREAAEGGGVELWALAKWNEKAKQQIKAGEYKWTSVAIWRKAVDPVSGEDMGPVLTSVALTNHPFIQGMAPLAASRRGRPGERVLAEASVWGQAESPEEAVIGLRNIFGLQPNATPEELQASLDQFGGFVAANAFPIGIDAEYLFRRLRELFGLPALAGWEDIAGAAGVFLSGLVSNAAGLATASEGAAGENDMSTPSTLTAQLANILNVRDKDDAILAAAKTAAAAVDAIDKLKSLLGSADTQAVLADAAALATKVKENEGMLAGLDALVKGMGGGTETDPKAANDVEQEAATAVASISGLKPEQRKVLEPVIRLAVVAVRERALANQESELVLAGMEKQYGKDHAERLRPIVCSTRRDAIGSPDKLAQFRKSFPLPDAQRELLTRPIFAGDNAVQMGGAATGLPPTNPTHSTPTPVQQPGALPMHLAAMPGANSTEKARQYLCAKLPGFKEQSLMNQNFHAGEYLQNGAPAL